MVLIRRLLGLGRVPGLIRWSCFASSSLRQTSLSLRDACSIAHQVSVLKDGGGFVRRNLHLGTAFRGELLQFRLSDIGEGIKEVTVKEWFVKVGDQIGQFDQLCEVQSDKASVTITSRYDGIIRKMYFNVDDIAQTGDVLVDIEADGVDSSADSDVKEVQDAEAVNVDGTTAAEAFPYALETSGGGEAKALATPAVRRMAAEHGLNIHEVPGSGKNGRVLKEDVAAFVARKRDDEGGAAAVARIPTVDATAAAKPEVAAAQMATASYRVDRTEKIKGITKVMVKTMNEALKIPHFGYQDEADISRLVEARNEMKEACLAKGIKLSYLPFIIKACSLALTGHPHLNAYFDVNAETMTYKADHNIGVAMDTADGLVVPNVKKVQDLSVLQIAAELNRMHGLGLAGKLGQTDLEGGTFTVSNIGAIGGTYASPVILPPQVVIGAVGKVQVLPRFDERGDLMTAHVVNLSWSGDHRVVDGAALARFSNQVKSYLENPSLMLLDMR